MKKIDKELHDKISKRYLADGLGYASAAKNMYMKSSTFENVVKGSKDKASDPTYRKLQAYANGDSWEDIQTTNSKKSSSPKPITATQVTPPEI